MHAPRLSALIGGPVAQEVSAAPVLRPALGRAGPVAKMAEPAGAEPLAAPMRSAGAGSESAAVTTPPTHLKSRVIAPAAPMRPAAQASTPSPRMGVAPLGPSPLPRAGAAPDPDFRPKTATPESEVARFGDRRTAELAATAAMGPRAPAQPVRRAVALKAPHMQADTAPNAKARPLAPAGLPHDPEHLAASAARLGLVPVQPVRPPAAKDVPVRPTAPQMTAANPPANPPALAPAPPDPPRLRADGKRPLPPAPRPTADGAVQASPNAVAAPVSPSGAQPEVTPRRADPVAESATPPVLRPPPTGSPNLRPAERQAEPLPPSPPQAGPTVRVVIGRVTLVGSEPKGQGGPLGARKSGLAPVNRRAARDHAIPRSGGH